MVYVFGEFELSEEEFSLRRLGKRVPLEPRALRVLLVLVGKPGKLLDKKALLEAVWKGTFVEETTLTRAIAVIRKQLHDDPRAPKYIETVPTRGYRFIAPVEIGLVAAVPESAGLPAFSFIPDSQPLASQPQSVVQVPAGPALPEVAKATARPHFTPDRKFRYYGAAAICLAAAALALLLVHRSHRSPALSTKDTLVLAEFTNTSGDPVFDDALRQGMLVQLEQSPVLRLASDAQIRTTLKLMGMHTDAPLTSEVGREVCQRIGGAVVLDGSISRLGNEYVIGLRARGCSTGEELDAEQVQIARKEDALNALSQIATRFRARVGEASATIHDLDMPLAEATTPSMDALKAFSRGVKLFNAKGSAAAVPLFQQATELDPQFAEAHVWLGRMYADLGQEAASIQSTQVAYALRTRASDRERFSIDVSYDLLVTGNLEKARAACDAWIQMYPRDVYPRAFLSGMVYPAYGQHERALEEAKQAMAIDPDFVVGYRNAATSLIALNRPGEAEQVLQQASQRRLFLPSFVTDSYRIAFLKDDADGMKRALDASPANPWMLSYQAATLARAGRFAQAGAIQEQALRLSRHGSRPELEAQLLIAASFTNLLYGYPGEATKQVQEALRLSSGRSVESAAALVLAMTGNSSKALTLVNDLRRRFPQDTVLMNNQVPAIQAAVALFQKQPQQAVKFLEQTAQFELSLPLYPVFLRGQAYLALGQSPQAIAEFRKIADHPGLVMNDPLFNLVQLNLARAYTLAGQRESARAIYDTVRLRWSDADADFPALQQARREYSHL